ncbi:hypothetical protein CCX46_05010 [Pseudomonas sp. RU47]|uniref:hypothetical protein n=1 Tax=Pseudomonas sp. RU47 TaxID=2005388 RepID=UPI000FDD5242|nr:hypothetical protein [Pseudomonas sp. RU47]AZZ74521.1 hypothetical protein CCX46_05010 [Pseudomonas sp. RU47]
MSKTAEFPIVKTVDTEVSVRDKFAKDYGVSTPIVKVRLDWARNMATVVYDDIQLSARGVGTYSASSIEKTTTIKR